MKNLKSQNLLWHVFLLFFAQPTTVVDAQFGIKRKGPTNFQDLQQEAAAQAAAPTTGGGSGSDPDLAALLEALQGGGGAGGGAGGMPDLAQLQDLMADALKDPATMKQFEQMGTQFASALEQLGKMSPEQLEQQMQAALSMLTEDSMVDTVVQQRDAILAQLEATGSVPADELARFKADPKYFELKMRESFDQMKGILQDPEYLKLATQAMGSVAGGAGGGLPILLGDALKGLDDDDKIEEARLQLLKGDNPLAKLFDTPEMKDILHDPKKWKDTVKQGYSDILKDEL